MNRGFQVVKSWVDTEVVALLGSMTYDQVSEQTGWSRGRIYNAALRAGARKTEERIAMRKQERDQLQKSLLQEMMNTTVKADVLDFLAGMPDKSCRLVMTSPPYNLGKQYNQTGGQMDAMRFVYFHGWLQMILSEVERVLVDGGTLCLQVGQTLDWSGSLYPMDVMLFEDLRRTGLQYKSRIVWHFGHGLTPKSRVAERYETMLVLSKGEQAVFNPNPGRTPQKEPGKRAFKGPNKGGLSGNPMGAAPTNVWAIPSIGSNNGEKTEHPCQFPLELARRAVLMYSMAGDLICDPFSGSGTVQEAAFRTGRGFIGADLFYEDVRSKRMQAARHDLVSTLPGVSDDSVAVWQAEARKVERPARVENEAVEWSLF